MGFYRMDAKHVEQQIQKFGMAAMPFLCGNRVACKMVKNGPIYMFLDIFPVFWGSGNPFLGSK
jgi:hypothetical protein